MYLIRVFRHSKMMGIAFGGFALLSLFANAIKYEATPLFLWGMFSANAPVQQKYAVFQFVTTDEDTLNYTSFSTSNTFRTILVGSAELAATIAKTDTNPALKGYIAKFKPRLNKFYFDKIRNILVFDILKNNENKVQLQADSTWRNDLVHNKFAKNVKNTFIQTVVYQADGSVSKVK